MFKNKIFLGVFAGLAATIVKDGLNQSQRPLLDVILMFIIHLIYGLVLGLFVRKFGRKAFEVGKYLN